jgi:hypothetical protein
MGEAEKAAIAAATARAELILSTVMVRKSAADGDARHGKSSTAVWGEQAAGTSRSVFQLAGGRRAGAGGVAVATDL